MFSGTYGELPNRVHEVDATYKCDQISLKARFFYLPFRDLVPNSEDFVDFLFYRIVEFCIPKKERLAAREYVERTGDHRRHTELHEKAKDLFIKSKAQQIRAGEPAELILFSLLEGKLNAPQLACKMYLKTSAAMPVYGSDGIHAMYDEKSQELRVLWGEAKLYQDINAAMKAACASLKSFIEPNEKQGGDIQLTREIQIVRDHISVHDESFRNLVLEHFDPYSPASNKRINVFACLIGFDYEALVRNPRSSEKEFVALYRDYVKKTCEAFQTNVIESGLRNYEFIFMLLPFESVADFRKQFFKKLGVSD